MKIWGGDKMSAEENTGSTRNPLDVPCPSPITPSGLSLTEFSRHLSDRTSPPIFRTGAAARVTSGAQAEARSQPTIR
eukprot:4229265-Pleurochrysis_carterae.AAC.1